MTAIGYRSVHDARGVGLKSRSHQKIMRGDHMKRAIVCLIFVVGFAVLSVGTLAAAQTAAPSSTTLNQLIATANSEANAVFSQDKLFWGFSYTPTGSAGAASSVSADLIFQTQPGLDIHGWNFSSSNWVQGAAGPAGFTLSYTMEVCQAARYASAMSYRAPQSPQQMQSTRRYRRFCQALRR